VALRLRLGRGTKRNVGTFGAPSGSAGDVQTDLRTWDASTKAERQQVEQPAILDEVLIEEVSIDGMCGVY
jgi:mycofactocin precursor